MRAPKQKLWTVEDIEVALDCTARLMEHAGRDAHLLLPIWRTLERELNERLDAASIFASAKDRLTRSRDRTVA